MAVTTSHWTIELWGADEEWIRERNGGGNASPNPNVLQLWGIGHLMNGDGKGLFPSPNIANITRINVAGYWMKTLALPATYMRNLYGINVLRHAEHWMATGGRNGWIEYKSGDYAACNTPGFHGCLRGNYLPDGNLQLREVWI